MTDFHVQYPRSIPTRRPPAHTPAAPRFSLRWQHPISTLTSGYFGLQGAPTSSPQARAYIERMGRYFAQTHGPAAHEFMTCTDETGRSATIAVGYWTSQRTHDQWATDSDWARWWDDPERLEDGVGYWYEQLSCPYDRHETIYSHPSYRIGFSRTPDAILVPITTNGYFGAARDRIPLSAIDTLEPAYSTPPMRGAVRAIGRRIAVVVPHNLTVLRSGQFWHDAEPEQAKDYEHHLQAKLDRGMDHLEEHPDTGCLFLRRMTNLSADRKPRKETSIYAVFASLAGLESWSASHDTHLAIYRHAIAMNRKFGDRRDVVTWHELFVLPGANLFEYLNCADGTGLLPFSRHWTPA